jgi:hypothetical protein
MVLMFTPHSTASHCVTCGLEIDGEQGPETRAWFEYSCQVCFEEAQASRNREDAWESYNRSLPAEEQRD